MTHKGLINLSEQDFEDCFGKDLDFLAITKEGNDFSEVFENIKSELAKKCQPEHFAEKALIWLELPEGNESYLMTLLNTILELIQDERFFTKDISMKWGCAVSSRGSYEITIYLPTKI